MLRTTENYWTKIITIKHPYLKNKVKVNMVKIYYDSLRNTLNVWFNDPKKRIYF